ncbi:MAG TPA: TonB-dependent receptor, partial [Bacteroidota bacterium]|nr:TonB-dependent receptor [Bacteroidota bacterium]
ANDFDRYRVPGRGNGEEGTFYRNVGRSRRYGLELFAWFRPVGALSIQAAYTYSHFTYDLDAPIPILMDDAAIHKQISSGNWLPNSPVHRLVLGTRLDFPGGVSLDLNAETNSMSYIDGGNVESEAASGYTLLGARLAVRMQLAGVSGELSVQARNIGDVRYVAFTEPDPGGNAYQPGPGREFFLGVNVGL